jgi:hypothetical protein
VDYIVGFCEHHPVGGVGVYRNPVVCKNVGNNRRGQPQEGKTGMTDHLDIRGGLRAAREAWGGTLVEAEAGLKLLALSEGVEIRCSNEQLRRMENGIVPEEKWDTIVVALLALLYGVEVADISEVGAARIRSARDLLNRTSAWKSLFAGCGA